MHFACARLRSEGRSPAGFIFLSLRKDGVNLSLYSDRFRLPPKGREQGHDGMRARLTVTHGEESFELGATSAFTLMEGDLVEIHLPGGGGWGDPRRRKRSSIEADVEDGLISPAFARERYGFSPATSEN